MLFTPTATAQKPVVKNHSSPFPRLLMRGDPKRAKRNPRNAFGLRRPFGLRRVGSGQAETKKNARPVRAGREDIRSRALPISFWREELQVRHFRTKNKAKLLPDNRAEQRKSRGLSSAALKCFE